MRPSSLAPALFFSMVSMTLPGQSVTLKPFMESPAAVVSQDLGISTVKVEYHRPAVKGRKIWGGLVPFGEVWRTGANQATTISFTDEVQIGGKTLPAGTYGFFAIPGPEAWTLIFNKTAKQWGAYDYKASEDALRIQATPRSAPFQEYLGYAIQVAGPELLRVELGWERWVVGFDVKVDADGIYWNHLQAALGGAKPEDPAPFLQAARYCLRTGTHLEKALEWVDRSIQAKESYRNVEVKARLLHKSGRKAEAKASLEKAISLAGAAKAPAEDLAGLEKTRLEWK